MKYIFFVLTLLFAKCAYPQVEKIPQNIKSAFEGHWIYQDKYHSNSVIIKFERDKNYATFIDVGTGEAPTKTFHAHIKGSLLVIKAQREKNDDIKMEIIKGKLHLRTRSVAWDKKGNLVDKDKASFKERVFKRTKIKS